MDSTKIGEVVSKKHFIVKHDKQIVVDLPVSLLTDDCPIYKRPTKRPKKIKGINRLISKNIRRIKYNSKSLFLKLLSDENICSREWIYRQFDYMVGTNTITPPGSDSAIIRIKGTKKAICLTTNCNSSYCKLNPNIGASIAVAESYRNIIASGGEPLAITNCLNFGNPENPEIIWEFAEGIKGLSKAAKKFKTPVVSGNVSLYNENKSESIYPTPVISMVGLIENINYLKNQWFKQEGDDIILIGSLKSDFGGSQVIKYLKTNHKVLSPPNLDIDGHIKNDKFVYRIIRKFDISSVHDLSEGGFLIALAESCFNPSMMIGATIEKECLKITDDLQMFAETQGCYLLSCKSSESEKILSFGKRNNINVKIIGKVGGSKITIKNTFSLNVSSAFKRWNNSFPR